MTMPKCMACGGSCYREFRFGLLACSDCGLVINSAVWQGPAHLPCQEDWFGEDYALASRSFWERWFEDRNNRRTYRRIRRHGMSRGTMLEVGIGSGSLLGFMKARGWDVVGCDISPAVCQAAARRYGVHCHCGNVADMPCCSQYDVVIMNHVLEHMVDPVGALLAVRRCMRRGGLLHLAAPNIGCWEAFLPGWNSYEPYHLFYFTPATLNLVVAQAGFSIERVETCESFSGWFLAVLRSLVKRETLSESKKKVRAPGGSVSVLEHGYRLAMVGMGAMSWPLRLIQAKLFKGDEVIVLARA